MLQQGRAPVSGMASNGLPSTMLGHPSVCEVCRRFSDRKDRTLGQKLGRVDVSHISTRRPNAHHTGRGWAGLTGNAACRLRSEGRIWQSDDERYCPGKTVLGAVWLSSDFTTIGTACAKSHPLRSSASCRGTQQSHLCIYTPSLSLGED